MSEGRTYKLTPLTGCFPYAKAVCVLVTLPPLVVPGVAVLEGKEVVVL